MTNDDDDDEDDEDDIYIFTCTTPSCQSSFLRSSFRSNHPLVARLTRPCPCPCPSPCAFFSCLWKPVMSGIYPLYPLGLSVVAFMAFTASYGIGSPVLVPGVAESFCTDYNTLVLLFRSRPFKPL